MYGGVARTGEIIGDQEDVHSHDSLVQFSVSHNSHSMPSKSRTAVRDVLEY
jgi:hypothetical protein